jgi:hypothetical protein
VDLVLEYRSPRRMQKLAAQSAGELRVVDEHSAYLRLSTAEVGQEPLYRKLRELLTPADSGERGA